jgi:hypothetical protein
MRRWLGCVVVLLYPGVAESQAADFGWRASGGAGYGTVSSAGPNQEEGQTPAVYRVGVERSVGHRFAVGLEWTGTWYDGRFGRERRLALTATGATYLLDGLHVRAGVGPGVVSWVTVDGPPTDGPGDVVIGFSEGDPSVAVTAGVGYDLPLGVFQLTPEATWIGHRLHGATLSLLSAGARVWLRTRR